MVSKKTTNKKPPTKKLKSTSINTKAPGRGHKEIVFYYSNQRQLSAITSFKNERAKKEGLIEKLEEQIKLAKNDNLKIAARAEKQIALLKKRIEASQQRLQTKRTRLNLILTKITTRTYDKNGRRLMSEHLRTHKQTIKNEVFNSRVIVVYRITGEYDPSNTSLENITDTTLQKMIIPEGYPVDDYIRDRMPFDMTSADVEILSVQQIKTSVPKFKPKR